MNEKYYILIETLVGYDDRLKIKYFDESLEVINLGAVYNDIHALLKYMNDELKFEESVDKIPFKFTENEAKENNNWFNAIIASYERYGNHSILESNKYIKIINEIIEYKFGNKKYYCKDAYLFFLKVENNKIIDFLENKY